MDKKEQEKINSIKKFVENEYDNNVLPSLMDFIRIPNLSRDYDKEWNSNGLLEKAAKHLLDWVMKQNIKGLKGEIKQLENLSPFIIIEIESNKEQSDKKILMYGHLDKQPHFSGWKEGLSATDPKIINERLYGRGCSDDGYCLYSCILSIKTIQELGMKHEKVIIVIEGDEESGSGHIDAYLHHFNQRIGDNVNYVVCLDSGANDYNRLWLTTSLRGNLVAKLQVQVLQTSIHSGLGSGIIPSSFRILRQLLSRIEDQQTGDIIDLFQVQIPNDRYQELQNNAKLLGNSQFIFPLYGNTRILTDDPLSAFINKTWRAQLSITGQSGFPQANGAGNILRNQSTVKFSLRLPPTKDPIQASKDILSILSQNPPYNVKVDCTVIRAGYGFNAENLQNVMPLIQQASLYFFGNEAGCAQEGGSIPLMNKLQNKFPKAVFLIMGVLGPESNAHGPNEMLDIPFTKKLTCSIAHIISQL